MEIRVRATGALVSEQDFRRMFPNTSMPRPLTEAAINSMGGDIVFEGPQASGGTVYQYSMRQGIEQKSDGKWYTKYVIGPIFIDNDEATAAEQEAAYKARKDDEQAANVRADRDRKLAECDWVTLKAIDASNDGLGIQLPQVWMTYRQALRDITAQAGFPWNVTWPEKP